MIIIADIVIDDLGILPWCHSEFLFETSASCFALTYFLSDISAGNDEFEEKILVDQLEDFETLFD